MTGPPPWFKINGTAGPYVVSIPYKIGPQTVGENADATNHLFGGSDQYKLMDAVDKESRGPVPHTVLIAPGGKVLYRKSGSCEPLEIKKAIVAYLGRTYK